MPLPQRKKDESKENFLSRCMTDDIMKREYPDNEQRVAICMSKASAGLSAVESADFQYNVENYGFVEEITEDNFYIPSEAEYVDFNESEEEWDIATAKPGLWENIRKKKEREGKKYKPAKPGDPDRPDPEAWKKAQSKYKYENPKTGEVFTYTRQGNYKKDGVNLVYKGKAAKYQGRTVKLSKPFRTPGGPKKFAVYVKNKSGKVIIVRFGDPNMEIKKDNPDRRRSFRARHKCDTAKDKTTPRYWSCKMW